MSIILINNGSNTPYEKKKVELVKINNKHYIELESFEGEETIIQLALSLATEVDVLTERIKVLEERLKIST